MANTYSQIYIQIVFAVEGRQNLIAPEHNDELQKYVVGIVTGQKQKLIAINNMTDHFHILVGLQPDVALSDIKNTRCVYGCAVMNRQFYWFPWSVGPRQAMCLRVICSSPASGNASSGWVGVRILWSETLVTFTSKPRRKFAKAGRWQCLPS